MEKELVQGNLGEIGQYDVDFKNGDIVLNVKVQKGVVGLELSAKLDGKQVAIAALEYLKNRIPGQMDDAIINALEEKLKAL